MSTIDKISIQGIRSFGPDAPRTMQFFNPLTLILGQNGCGKTTIIESLKYISTGDMPPGAGRGAFVHDPKLAGEISVRGQIKLLFRDTRGQIFVTSRSLEATQRAKRLECKTLDATMTKKTIDGSNITLSSKCSDFEALMTTSLGVAKPILTNVIFCHQEESNWPLDEGKKVKEKFDAIFSATRYIKCLETIKKQRAEMKLKVRNMKDVLVEIKKWKDEANRKRVELQRQMEQQTECKEEKERLSKEMQPLLERLKKISSVEADIAKINGEINGKQHQLKSLRDSQAELRETLSEQITCSDEELKLMIREFQHNLSEKENELKRVESEMSDVERQVHGRQREVSAAQRQQGELDAAHNNHNTNIYIRNTKVTQLVDEFDFNEYQGVKEFSDSQVEAVLSLLIKLMEEEYKITQGRKREFEQDEQNLQSVIDKIRSQEAALEQDIKTKGSQIEEMSRKMKVAKQSLMRNESSLGVANLDEIHENIKEVEGKITEEEKKHNIQKMSEEIDNAKREKQDIDHSLTDIRRVVGRLNRQAEARSQFDFHVKEKKDLENKVEFLKRKAGDELEHLLNEIPEENMKNKLDACISNIRSMISEERRNIEKLNKRKAQLDTTIKGDKNQIEKKEFEIKELDSKIDSICQGSDLDSALEKSKDLKEKLTRERGDLSSSITVLKRFTDKLKQEDCCPLCHRNFAKKDEVLQLIEELEGKVSSVPGKLEVVKRRLAEEESQHEQVIQLKPQRDQANRARQDLDKLRSQMEASNKELNNVGLELDNKQEILDVTMSDEETARQIQPDVITIENHIRKIQTLQDQVDDLQATLGTTDGGLSMEEATTRQSELEEKHRRASARVEELQEQLQEHKNQLQNLKDRKLRLSTEELSLKTKIQETQKLKEEVQQLEESRVVVEEGREKAREEVAPFKYKLMQKTADKTNITKDKETFIDGQNSKVNEINEKQRGAQEVHRSIVRYVSGGGEERLKKSQQLVTTLTEKVALLQSRKKVLEELNRKVEKDITSRKERKRNLDDEKKIREKEVYSIKLKETISKLEESVKEFNIETLIDEKSELNEKGNHMQNKKASLSGRIEEIDGMIRSLEGDLRRKEIRDAEKNYKDKFIEMKCIDIASDDLNKYYKALDTAIMRFHQDKMKTINEIIRELWRSTYKGNDIDYVEIKTDETESQGADKRRTYNYRVVMVKSSTEMDMRGRCSAGQKVLASLIIRMALAETFSANCGILALDEPTTNLDRENIDALSLALVSIVNSRRAQKNLQLIVITHDSDFLEKMTHADFIDFYYEVTRDEKGLSIISRHSASFL